MKQIKFSNPTLEAEMETRRTEEVFEKYDDFTKPWIRRFIPFKESIVKLEGLRLRVPNVIWKVLDDDAEKEGIMAFLSPDKSIGLVPKKVFDLFVDVAWYGKDAALQRVFDIYQILKVQKGTQRINLPEGIAARVGITQNCRCIFARSEYRSSKERIGNLFYLGLSDLKTRIQSGN